MSRKEINKKSENNYKPLNVNSLIIFKGAYEFIVTVHIIS